MEPDLFKAFCEEFHREVNRLRASENAAADAKRRELDRIERRTRRIVELITEDDAPTRALKQELVALEARQDTLREELCQSARNWDPDRHSIGTPVFPSGQAGVVRTLRRGS
jgi:septal ring factor EnvC (AmiA/AmiB activator)